MGISSLQLLFLKLITFSMYFSNMSFKCSTSACREISKNQLQDSTSCVCVCFLTSVTSSVSCLLFLGFPTGGGFIFRYLVSLVQPGLNKRLPSQISVVVVDHPTTRHRGWRCLRQVLPFKQQRHLRKKGYSIKFIPLFARCGTDSTAMVPFTLARSPC